jgi:uncharacterized membrane protein YhaH (DUF805 family)
MRTRRETIAALVNGAIVLLLPFAVLAIASHSNAGQNSVTVHPPGWSPALSATQHAIPVVVVVFPFAILAACRTWVHARRWRARCELGWQGVAEAGGCGLGTALLILLPSIIARPAAAPPYIIAYGGMALVAGLVVGLILRVSALAMLRFTGTGSP